MQVTFKKGDLRISFECELMWKSENIILTSFNVKTFDNAIIDIYEDEINNSNEVCVGDEISSVEYKIKTVKVDKHENYSIIRINC